MSFWFNLNKTSTPKPKTPCPNRRRVKTPLKDDPKRKPASPKTRAARSVTPALRRSCSPKGRRCHLMVNKDKKTAKYNICNRHGPNGKCNVNCQRVAGALAAAEKNHNTRAIGKAKKTGTRYCGWKKQ